MKLGKEKRNLFSNVTISKQENRFQLRALLPEVPDWFRPSPADGPPTPVACLTVASSDALQGELYE